MLQKLYVNTGLVISSTKKLFMINAVKKNFIDVIIIIVFMIV